MLTLDLDAVVSMSGAGDVSLNFYVSNSQNDGCDPPSLKALGCSRLRGGEREKVAALIPQDRVAATLARGACS